MKQTLLSLILLVTCLSAANGDDCKVYDLKCVCYPAVPFEGYKMFLHERCDDKESAETDYALPIFDTQELCESAIETEPRCQSLR